MELKREKPTKEERPNKNYCSEYLVPSPACPSFLNLQLDVVLKLNKIDYKFDDFEEKFG